MCFVLSGLVLGKDIRNGFNIIDEYVMFALIEGSGVREGSLDVWVQHQMTSFIELPL